MSPISPVDGSSTSNNVNHGTPAEIRKSGNVIRVDIPVPFFLKRDVFTNFKKPEYSWNGDEQMMSLLVTSKESRNPIVGNTGGIVNKAKPVDYSIGGCPLECPFDLNEDFGEALVIDSVPLVFDALNIPKKYGPLSVIDGQMAIANLCKDGHPFVEELGFRVDKDGFNEDTPVLAFVNGPTEGNKLTLTGARKSSFSTDVHVMGKFRPEAKMLTVEAFRKHHYDNGIVDNRPMTMVAHAVYEKLHGEYPSKGNVYMEFLFKDPSGVFGIPPEDSICKIAIRPLRGDANPSMCALWEEVEDLEKWINILSHLSNNSIADRNSFLNSSAVADVSDMTEIMQAINNLLAREPVIDLHRTSAMEFSDSLDLVLRRVVNQERADCDFTDILWSILRKCESADELQDCLRLVFQAVSNKMYRPYLLLTNGTQMAKNLTLVMKEELTSLLQLARHDVMVTMIIECGLVKLFKDYNFALAMSHLIERGEVDSFAPNSKDVSTSLSNIQKLHCILEVMCLSKERLNMSVNYQAGHVKKMLKYFSNNPLNWEQTHHFDVPPNDIRRTMAGLHPIYFKVKIDSELSVKWTSTSVIISPEAYINYKSDSSDEKKAREYYVYLLFENGRLANDNAGI